MSDKKFYGVVVTKTAKNSTVTPPALCIQLGGHDSEVAIFTNPGSADQHADKFRKRFPESEYEVVELEIAGLLETKKVKYVKF